MRMRSELQSIAVTVVLLAAIVTLRVSGRKTPTGPQTVHLRSGGRGSITALVSGAGLGTRVMRLTPASSDVGARLGAGPLRVVALSLRPIELRATDVRYGPENEHVAHLFGRGHMVSLRADSRSAGVRTTF